MKIAIVAGGGGHFAPALAVIQALPKEDYVLVFGRKHAFEGDKAVSLEYQTTCSLGIPFIPITTGRLQRKLTRYTVPSFVKLPKGFFQATKALRSFKPDVLFSTGGYIAIPVVFAAHLLRIPIVIHEQTLEAGLANKFAARFAKKICISWKSSFPFFPEEKTVLTGNPVKQFSFSDFNPHTGGSLSDEDLPLIYVTGGSGGSHAMNDLVFQNLERLLEKYRIIHQTGDAQRFRDYERLSEKRKALPELLQKRYWIEKFIEPKNVGTIMKKADVVVARAGMNTVTELLYFKKPALLIPLPFGQGNEQRKNAEFFKDAGLGEMLLQNRELTPDKFMEMLTLLVEKRQKYILKESVETHGMEHATEKIIGELSYAVQKT